MINHFFRLFLMNETKTPITKEQEASILHGIDIINFKRMKILLSIFLIIEILFIVINDIPNLINISLNVAWSDKRYFILHLLLSIACIVGIITTKILLKNDTRKLMGIRRMVVPGLTMIILILVSIINGLDQIKAGSASSVFIANLLICSATIMLKSPLDFLVYSVPFSTFTAALIIFQKDTAILNSNIINGVIFFAAVIIISKTIYNSQFAQMSENILLEEANQKLNYLSNHDPLTGLINRRYFEAEAKQKKDINNQLNHGTALILLDIDHFKSINDTFGHPIGDIVLQEVSKILLENINHADLATRWGGEEFLLLLYGTSVDEACALADKIRISMRKNTIIIDDLKINITASFGVSELKGDYLSSFDSSYKIADKALYQAKAQGRNQVVAGY